MLWLVKLSKYACPPSDALCLFEVLFLYLVSGMVQKVWLAIPILVLYLLTVTMNCDVGFIHLVYCFLTSLPKVGALGSSRDKLWILKVETIALLQKNFNFFASLLFLLLSALFAAPYHAVTVVVMLENLCRFFKGVDIGVCFEGSQCILHFVNEDYAADAQSVRITCSIRREDLCTRAASEPFCMWMLIYINMCLPDNIACRLRVGIWALI